MAGYHQYHAVNVALAETLRACMTVSDLPGIRDEGTYFARQQKDAKPGDRRVGVIWHTQGSDKNTRAVFGDYVSIYDIERAVKDGATVPIYYESRLAKLELKESERPRIDPEFEEVTEGEEVESKERLKTKWAQLEALVGAEKRVRLIAEDLVKHFEGRLEAMDGKAMIVGMSRRICVELYNAITAIRPDWKQDHQNDRDHHHDDDEDDKRNDNLISIKIVMTGSASDPVEWQEHIRTKARRETLAKRFKDPEDPFSTTEKYALFFENTFYIDYHKNS
jgi:type I restriction enzyme R subunit